MRVLFAVAVGLLMSSAAFAVLDVQNPGDPGTSPVGSSALVACTDDIFCSSFTEPGGGFVADGEWNPVSNVSGFMTTGGILLIVNEICGEVGQILPAGANFDNSVPRGFAWDKNAASGKFWVGSWANALPPTSFVGLVHMDALGNEIAAYAPIDPVTTYPIQPSGIAMDYATGHMWVMLRNNPSGTRSRIMLFDTNVPDGTAPVLLSPADGWDVAWNTGIGQGSSGLEYRASDCTIIANLQDFGTTGIARLETFQDVGVAAPVLLGFCDYNNLSCANVASSTATNHPWGISVSEDPAFGAYVIFSDLNRALGCATLVQPMDLHIIALPAVTGQCGTTAVEPSTWGQIKHDYK